MREYPRNAGSPELGNYEGVIEVDRRLRRKRVVGLADPGATCFAFEIHRKALEFWLMCDDNSVSGGGRFIKISGHVFRVARIPQLHPDIVEL